MDNFLVVAVLKSSHTLSSLDDLSYNNNPFYKPLWETVNLAIPNHLTRMEVSFTQLAIKYNELALIHDPLNAQAKEDLEALRNIFEKQVSEWGLAD